MTSPVRPGWLRRTWTAVKRGLLGKSSRDYMRQFTGSNQYFEEAVAAQRGWPAAQEETIGTPTRRAAKK